MRRRHALTATVTAVLLAATAAVAWRVLRPAEVVTPATMAYPEVAPAKPGPIGALAVAPLFIDDRLRIFAKNREVWSDAPASYHYERSAYWAYRRWPAQVTGVAVVEAPRPIAVTAWTDGVLAAINTTDGTVAWRTQAEPLAKSYTGRRTGAQTVYTPPGLYTTATHVITAASDVRAYSADTGQEQWRVPVPPPCRGTVFTTATDVLIHNTCANTVTRYDSRTGTQQAQLPATSVEPVSCKVGHSRCTAMRVTTAGTVAGWALTHPTWRESTPLATPGAHLTAQTVVVPQPRSVTAVDLTTGRPLWTWPAPTSYRLLSANPTRTLILESKNTLVSLNSTTGTLLLRTSLQLAHEPPAPHDTAAFYTSGSYLTFERTNPSASPHQDDNAYYYTHRPILVANAGPTP